MFKFYFLSLIFIIIISCTTTSKLYRENRYVHGLLEANKLDSLKSFLQKVPGTILQDTIIIKYDFNGDDCWKFLDEKDQSYNDQVLSQYKHWVKEVGSQRPNVSVYQFRENGKTFSKLKRNNTDIQVDDGFLFNLLFSERSTCGSSVIILPSGKFLRIRSDSHFEALSLTALEIDREINK